VCAAGLLLALALPLRAPAATAPVEKSRPSRPSYRNAPISLAERARLKQASPEELVQFHNEMKRNGWASFQIAVIPIGYERDNGMIHEGAGQFATLHGDVDGDGRPEWVVGCDHVSASGSTSSQDDQARIVIFKKDGAGRWRLLWRSPGLGEKFGVPRFNIEEVEKDLDQVENLCLPLALLNVNGDDRLEILYYCWSESEAVGALPGIYRYEGNRWVNVAPQSDRFSVLDLDGDGKLEVVTGSRRIGYGMGDDDVPRVWRWNGRQYEEASREFPQFYATLAARYSQYVRRMQVNGEPFQRAIWDRAIQKANSLKG
jgi:hypothetical protein